MSADLVVLLLGALAFGGFIWFINFIDLERSKEKLRATLTKMGAKDIVLTSLWSDSDRGNDAFEVEYTDAQGVKWNRKCKISLWSADIYWKDQL